MKNFSSNGIDLQLKAALLIPFLLFLRQEEKNCAAALRTPLMVSSTIPLSKTGVYP